MAGGRSVAVELSEDYVISQMEHTEGSSAASAFRRSRRPAGGPSRRGGLPAATRGRTLPRVSSHRGSDSEHRDPEDRWDDVLTAYRAHLVLERGLSPHTVRAYLADLSDLAEHARRGSVHDPARLDLRTLRSWLASQRSRGRSRTTVARRATSVRVFTAWLQRTGRADSDAGALLASPRRQRPLPATLRTDQMRAVLDAAAATAIDDQAIGLRDVAARGAPPGPGAGQGKQGTQRPVRATRCGSGHHVAGARPPRARDLRQWTCSASRCPRSPGRPAHGAADGARAGGCHRRCP
jgi:hypothetical protein